MSLPLSSLAPAGASRLHFAARSEPRRNCLAAIVSTPEGRSVPFGRPGEH